jgi:copper chaperone NosL
MRTYPAAALCLCLLVAGCSESKVAVAPLPREPDSNAIGYYCHMTLKEHVGPKGQILLEGSIVPLWFTSVRDALTYAQQDLNESELAGFWVNDMGQGSWEQPAPGSWIAAKSAVYVLASSKGAAMGGNEAVPFKKRDEAEAFAREFGGRIADYSAALKYIAEMPVAPSEGVPR